MNKQNNALLFHIVKRGALPWYQAWGIRAAAIVLALLFCALVTSLTTGENPLQVYSTMIYGAVGTPRKIWILGQNIALLLCVSLAVTPAFRMRFWNIGGARGCACRRGMHDLPFGQTSERGTDCGHGRIKHRRRCDMGSYTGHLQGQMEHQ